MEMPAPLASWFTWRKTPWWGPIRPSSERCACRRFGRDRIKTSVTRMSWRMSVGSFENQRRRSLASASSAGMMQTVSLVAVLSSGP